MVWWASLTYAAGPLNLPTAAGIAPGDLLINDSFNGWVKLDPATNQLYSLPWGYPFPSVRSFVFDLDGAVIGVRPGSPTGAFARIHPVTGQATFFGPPTIPTTLGFDIAPNGDLILAKSATSASINNGVWSGGSDGRLLRYSRQTGKLTNLPKPQNFSPELVAIAPNGETYVTDFFRGLIRFDLQTG